MIVRVLKRQAYEKVFPAMKKFTEKRDAQTTDEIWIVEHDPVYTLGQNADRSHILEKTTIPVCQTDRGGEVTYHGPGQSVFYFLFDLKRRERFFARSLVSLLEQTVLKTLSHFRISGALREGAPGVYLENGDRKSGGGKIAAVGLKVKANGCSYHGLSLNVAMDLSPFTRINPCGFRGLKSVDMKTAGFRGRKEEVERTFIHYVEEALGEKAIWKDSFCS